MSIDSIAMGLDAVRELADAPALLDAAERHLDLLADALHDGPLQSLVVARYAADAAVRGGDVTQARDAVQRALVELRLTLWGLRPRGAGGLAAALGELAVHLDVTISLQGDPSGLSCTSSVTAYRLVQAVAAPDAPGVRVVVRRDADLLVLDVSGGRPLVDVASWRTRARALGGDLRCRQGALRLSLPLAPVQVPRLSAVPHLSIPDSKAAP